MVGKVKIRVDKVFKGDGASGRMWKSRGWERLDSQKKKIRAEGPNQEFQRELIMVKLLPGTQKSNDLGELKEKR